MLSKLHSLLRDKVYKRILEWRGAMLPSSSFSAAIHRCCITIAPEKIHLVYLRRTANKAELVLSESFAYKQVKDIKLILSRVVEKYALAGVACSWVLQPEQYQLLQTEALPVTPAEFQAAIRWKVKDLLRFPVEDAVIDSFSLPVAKLPTSLGMIMLVVARASVLRPICDQINGSGLHLTTIDIPELSLRNLMINDDPGEKSTALMYLQETMSQLIITQQQELYFARRLDFGLQSFKAASVTEESQELTHLMDEFSLDIQRSFDYFQSQWRQPEPMRILLGMELPVKLDLAALLAKRLNAEICLIDINRYFDNQPNIDLKSDGFFLPLLGGSLREWNEAHAARH